MINTRKQSSALLALFSITHKASNAESIPMTWHHDARNYFELNFTVNKTSSGVMLQPNKAVSGSEISLSLTASNPHRLNSWPGESAPETSKRVLVTDKLLQDQGLIFVRTKLTHWPQGNVAIILKTIISENMLWIKIISTSCEIALWWMPSNTIDDRSSLL